MNNEELINTARYCARGADCLDCPMYKAGYEDPACTETLLLSLANALESQATIKWHKLEYRQLTEKERAYYMSYDIDIDRKLNCKMPNDGETVLISTNRGMEIDTCRIYPLYGHSLKRLGGWSDVLAWAALPWFKDGEDS